MTAHKKSWIFPFYDLASLQGLMRVVAVIKQARDFQDAELHHGGLRSMRAHYCSLMVLMPMILWSLLCFMMQRVQESFSLLEIRQNFDDFDDTECRAKLRFGKADVFLLLEVLRSPDKFVCSQRTVWSKLEGLCILLKRLLFILNVINEKKRILTQNVTTLTSQKRPFPHALPLHVTLLSTLS